MDADKPAQTLAWGKPPGMTVERTVAVFPAAMFCETPCGKFGGGKTHRVCFAVYSPPYMARVSQNSKQKQEGISTAT